MTIDTQYSILWANTLVVCVYSGVRVAGRGQAGVIQVLKHSQYGADPERDSVAFELRRPLPQPEPEPEPEPEPAAEPEPEPEPAAEPEPEPQPELAQTSPGAVESAIDEAERLRQRRIEESAAAAVETDSVGEDDARGGGDEDGECFSTPRASEAPLTPFGTPSEGIPPCTDEGEVVD